MKNDEIKKEAKRITKWNKKIFSKKLRRSSDRPPGKSGYKKNGYDARKHTIA